MNKIRFYAPIIIISWIAYVVPIASNQSQNARPISSPSFHNWRLGFGLGLEYLALDATLKIQPPPRTNMDARLSHTGKHFQIAPTIEFGKNITNNYYLGLLLSWRYSGSKNNTRSTIADSTYFNHQITLNNYGNFLLKGGYNLNSCTMVYGLIGPTFTNWSHTSTQTRSSRTQNRIDLKRNSIGLGIGLGFEHLFKPNYAISIDYTHYIQSGASKNRVISYTYQGVAMNDDVNKKVDLSFSTIAVRFTTFFSL